MLATQVRSWLQGFKALGVCSVLVFSSSVRAPKPTPQGSRQGRAEKAGEACAVEKKKTEVVEVTVVKVATFSVRICEGGTRPGPAF